MTVTLNDHEPRRLEGSTQAFCEATRVWLLVDRWGHVIASSVDQFPGLRVIEKPRETSYREY